MTPNEERAVLERCAHEAEIWDSEPLSGHSIAQILRSLPLESKEVDAEPVAWMTTLAAEAEQHFLRANQEQGKRLAAELKCAEYEQASLGSLHYAGDLLKRAEAAEKKCAELEHRVSELLGDNALAQEAIVEQEKISEAWKALLERAEAQIKEHIEAGAANQRVMLDKWTAEKHVRQQTQERLAKALDFIFDYVELSPDDVVGQKKYDAITGGMK